MRRIFTLSLLSAILFALPLSAQKREHRAVWMSAYTGCWPSGKLTANNAERQKEICRMDLDSLQRSNFTTIYYHARVMCDATYDSKYEPWSSYVSTARGVEPAFDPFGFLVEEAHARGLEVYAWLNPYRYLDSSYQEDWGSAGGDKNYENSHPEWLIKWKNGSHTWTILNPALPEVKQRIVDVIADIMDKYDVDGIVFDDYFYQSSLPEEYDAEWYNAYVAEAEAAEETPMSQLDWRRENVNDMVRKVNAYIKSTKPWVRFGIGPAGIACTDESIAEKYGILPSPGHDNQYNSIASEPVAWLHEGSIDFISPQIYWLDSYATLAPWWYETAGKFNRHCYTSQTLSSFSSAASMNVYVNQIDLTRTNDILEAPGYVFFQWRLLKSSSKRIERKDVKLLHWLRENAYHDHALPPAVTWLKADCPGVVSNLKRDGRTLSWSGPENVRYTVYAVPADVPMEDFRKEAEYLRGISYDTTFEIPQAEANYPKFGISDENLDAYNYAVAVFDRYGNEYSATFVGSEASVSDKPTLTYPLEGDFTPNIFEFKWEGTSPLYEVMVATDPEMENVVARKEVSGNFLASSELCTFEAGKDYYWTVTARDNNAAETRSDVNSFKVDVFRIVSIANEATDVDLSPIVEWSEFDEGATYRLEISERWSFSLLKAELTTNACSMAIPDYLLAGNTHYYARVIGTLPDGSTQRTATVEFTTRYAEVPMPTILAPASDGETMYSNKCIALQPQEGTIMTYIMVSASKSFPARSSYTGSFEGRYHSPNLSEIKMISTPLEDGKTYYTRARYSYRDESGAIVYTDWTPARSFVYSAASGINEVATSGVYVVSTPSPVLVAGEAGVRVDVFSADGRMAASLTTDEAGNADLSGVGGKGAYLLKVVFSGGETETLKFVKD